MAIADVTMRVVALSLMLPFVIIIIIENIDQKVMEKEWNAKNQSKTLKS